MTKSLGLILLLAVVVVAVMVVLGRVGRSRHRGPRDIQSRKLLTEREQAMYFRLRDAYPDGVVLCQVAFSALLTAKDQATRATFNRKVADFAVTSRAFEVLAVIELDDASHRNRAEQDKARDQLLERAGYRVIRFKNVPDLSEAQRALFGIGDR